jgi:ABC-type phosphate transport system substrate-binding protein
MRLPTGVAVTLLLALAVPCRGADEFTVIVHPSVAGASARRPDLAAVFLRQATKWGNGVAAVPVDQSGASAVRRAFSDSVLGMPAAQVVQYWQKQMFAGNPLRPPAVKGSDEEVISFVAKTEGAVGYVSKAAAVPPEVKTLNVID